MYAADMAHPDAALEDKLFKLFRMRRDTPIDLNLTQPYQKLLEYWDNPHLDLPPVIHVAGTNGKGSVIAMLRAIFAAAGYRVHAYTSPHLKKFNERIVLAGQEITDEALHPLLDEVLAFSEKDPLTFFEATTAIAFQAFRSVSADIVLLETGLGGRLDCSNVIKSPLATLITSIGYDHTEFLGETIPEIAFEKAGIMKPAAPCLVARQSEAEALPVFKKRAAEIDAPLQMAGEDWSAAMSADLKGFDFSYGEKVSCYPRPALLGDHQIDNAALVLACLKTIEGFEIMPAHIKSGLENVRWRGRLQKTDRTDLNGLLHADSEIWYDGGHNESAARILARQIERWGVQDDKELHLVVGMMGHKDHEAFLKPLVPLVHSVSCVEVDSDLKQSLSDELAALARKAGAQDVRQFQNVTEALDGACGGIGDQKAVRVLVCGSLYIADQVI